MIHSDVAKNEFKMKLNKESKDPAKNSPNDIPKNLSLDKTSAANTFKAKAPSNLLLPPSNAHSKPAVKSPLQATNEGKLPKSPKSPSPRSPKSPRSPGLIRQFQAVRTGMQFVNSMKPG